MTEMTLKEIATELKKFDSALIFSHARPDGDTLGSAMALKTALINLGMEADVVCASDIPEKYDIFPAFKTIKKPAEINKKYAAHVSVDISVESMFGDSYNLYAKNANLFNIDHHVSNSRYAKYNFVRNNAACCEIIYEFMQCLGAEITSEIADYLILGIITDTGNFMHSNVTENTFFVASKLVAAGARIHDITYRMFKDQTKVRALLFARVISKMRFFLDDKLAIISVLADDFEQTGAKQELTEGFIDFPLSIRGVEVAVSIMESKNNCYKVSFRSKGKVNVNEVASVFGGGGHILASGCMICGFYEDVKDKIIKAVSDVL